MQRIISEDFLCEVISGVLSFILGKTKYDKKIANLFGITSTVMTSADGQKCFNINQPTIDADRLKDEEKWWKHKTVSAIVSF